MQQTIITFPDIKLAMRDAHKLRGYFGRLFQDHSPLLHNHLQGGGLRYKYPLVQYKVIDGIPMLVGLEEGASLLMQLFLEIRQLNINNQIFEILDKNIQCKKIDIGYSETLQEYHFKTFWMPLNQKNYAQYIQSNELDQKKALQRILNNNILSLFKGVNVWLQKEERIMSKLSVQKSQTNFKDKAMLAFRGAFFTNAILPEYCGIGKSVARGFGTIKLID